MSVIEQATAETAKTSDFDNLDHVVCGECSPNLALCGLDASDMPWNDTAENPCVVCADLEPLPCPRCGR